MQREYNSQTFTPEEMEKGLHVKFLNALLELNGASEKYYNDIHITSDGYCTIIEWEKIPFDHEWGGQFIYVSEDDAVTKTVRLPDGSYEYASTPGEQERLIQDFIVANPDWRRSSQGSWINIKTGEEKY